MDLSDLRVIVTAVSFIAFIGVVFWAYSNKQKKRFDDAANLPFLDDDEGVSSTALKAKQGEHHE